MKNEIVIVSDSKHILHLQFIGFSSGRRYFRITKFYPSSIVRMRRFEPAIQNRWHLLIKMQFSRAVSSKDLRKVELLNKGPVWEFRAWKDILRKFFSNIWNLLSEAAFYAQKHSINVFKYCMVNWFHSFLSKICLNLGNSIGLFSGQACVNLNSQMFNWICFICFNFQVTVELFLRWSKKYKLSFANIKGNFIHYKPIC